MGDCLTRGKSKEEMITLSRQELLKLQGRGDGNVGEEVSVLDS